MNDQALPWRIDVDVFMTAVSQVSFDTITLTGSQAYNGRKQGSVQNCEIGFDVLLAAGTWTYEHLVQTGNSNGIVTLQLNGATVGTLDTYTAGGAFNVRQNVAGIAVASPGRARLRLLMASKNGSSAGYELDVSHVTLRRTS